MLATEGWLLWVKLTKCCTALSERPYGLFGGLISLSAEQALSESPMAILRVNLAKCCTALSESLMAIIGSKNSKKCTGDNINLGVSPQSYNPSKISGMYGDF